MTSEVKALLKPIIKALNKGDNTARDLWDILTALRGPDEDDNEGSKKTATTARFRYAIGLRSTAKCYGVGGYAQIIDSPLPLASEYSLSAAYNHFNRHFIRALYALERKSLTNTK